MREVVALPDRAAETLQRVRLLGRFDTLGHDVEIERAGETEMRRELTRSGAGGS